MNLARQNRNQTHTSIQILQKATKGTKGRGENCDSLFPLLPSVKFRESNFLKIAENKMHAGEDHQQV
jgi:hypothetical protein